MGYALGIDLGTTFTAVAVTVDRRVEVVSLGNHAVTIPSVVFLRDDGEVIVGDVAQRRGQSQPERLAREFKRRFGDSTPIMLGHTPYSAERLMAAVLTQVVSQVSERYGGPPERVAIAHPANWGPFKIELLQQASRLADLGGASLVTEPEAAAVHFAAGERLDVGDVVAVYDLGGGTFDAAVLRRTATGFETIGEPQGIERLGGIDFDEAVMSHVRATLGTAIESLDMTDPATRTAMTRLREECVSAKEALSEDSEVTIPVMLPGLQMQVRLTRSEFEDAIRPALRETVATLRRAIDVAGITPGDVRTIVLAGGSSRIPLVNELVGELGRPLAVDAHPKHTVALGAARVASLADALPAAAAAPIPGPVVAAAEPTSEPVTESSPASTEPTVAAATPTPRATEPSPPGAKKAQSTAAKAGTIAVGLAVAGVMMFAMQGGFGGGSGTKRTTTTTARPTTTAAKPTTTVAPTTTAQACASRSTRCVFIDAIEVNANGYKVEYSTVGYTPRIDGTTNDHHIHFFYDTVKTSDAGAPGAGPWVLWDLDPQGRMIMNDGQLKPSTKPQRATKLCAVVATNGHAVDTDPKPSCIPLP